jgi:DNA-binding MarR family transcriptional regulator
VVPPLDEIEHAMAQSRAFEEQLVKSARVLAWITKSLERACARSGVSLAKYRVLVVVERCALRSAEVACLARVGAPTLTALAESLVRAGLVERVPSRSDRRGVRLRITPAGVEAVRRTDHALAEELRKLTEVFGETDAVVSVAAAHDRTEERVQRVGPFAALGLEPCAASDGERPEADAALR